MGTVVAYSALGGDMRRQRDNRHIGRDYHLEIFFIRRFSFCLWPRRKSGLFCLRPTLNIL